MNVVRLWKTGLACVAAVVVLLGTSSAFGIAVGFYDLGVGVQPLDVSTNGTLVGGENGADNAFLWTQGGGIKNVGGDFRGIDWFSDDGHFSGVTTNIIIMAGRDNAVDAHGRVGFWNADGTGSGWYRLPWVDSVANRVGYVNALGVASDSSNYWVVGYRSSISPNQEAVRYKRSSNSNTSVGGPAGGGDSAQFDGASNTGVYAGRQRDSNNGGVRRGRYVSSWLDRAGGEGEVNSLSPDGTVAVGWDNNEPVYWDNLTGAAPTFDRHAIPMLAGETYGEAMDANADGSIIVGWSYAGGATAKHNWIWDADNGTREIGAFFASEGITVPGGWAFDKSGPIIRISGGGYDDLTVAGYATAASDHGYVVHVPEPGTIALLAIGGLMLLLFRRRR